MAENEGLKPIPDKEIIAEIEADNEKEYLRGIKKKNEGYLVGGLSKLERERIAEWISARFHEVKEKHNELCDDIDEYDEVYRMERKEIIGSDGDMPNYRSPISAVATEVIHANMLNTFSTPRNIGRVLPTEEGDIDKVEHLTTFMNWSVKNELNLFDNLDRLFHNSTKVGESPYLVHWVKEYGIEIKREVVMNPANESEPLMDTDTHQAIYQEIEEQKLLYNAPKLEPFSRKDYFQPENATMDNLPEWEMRRIRLSYDQYLRDELQGKMYPGSIQDIKGWGSGGESESNKVDFEGVDIPQGSWEKEFMVFYGRMRIFAVKKDLNESLEAEEEELEDEFIAIVQVSDGVLCQLRKNKFPLKMRPIGVDYFIPDDEGRRRGIGVVEFMEGIQKAYDVFYNQYMYSTMLANNPIGFFTPMGNKRDEIVKMKMGYMYPTTDPNSMKLFQFPGPDSSILNMIELLTQWSQLLFGISAFAAGVESKIDPGAPAKKAELVVAQGNVRLNAIIKRKVKTIQDILKRWFLLYKDNMPENKFMRIVGDSKDNPWKFSKITLEDFALKGIPDFELTANVLNENKALEAQKAVSVYQMMIQNPFFNPQTAQGIKALHSLTMWLIGKLDEQGLEAMLPQVDGETVNTPEEENARFLQGDKGEPEPNEDHVYHIKVHQTMLVGATTPVPVKEEITLHIQAHIQAMKDKITQQIVMERMAQQGGQGNGQGQNPTQQGRAGVSSQAGTPAGVVSGQPPGGLG